MRSMDRHSDEDEKISDPHSECFIDESPESHKKKALKDYVNRINRDFDLKKI